MAKSTAFYSEGHSYTHATRIGLKDIPSVDVLNSGHPFWLSVKWYDLYYTPDEIQLDFSSHVGKKWMEYRTFLPEDIHRETREKITVREIVEEYLTTIGMTRFGEWMDAGNKWYTAEFVRG